MIRIHCTKRSFLENLKRILHSSSFLPEGNVKTEDDVVGSGARSERLEAKKGLSEGLGVDVTDSVSISGPESLRSSNSSMRSSMSPASISRSAPKKMIRKMQSPWLLTSSDKLSTKKVIQDVTQLGSYPNKRRRKKKLPNNKVSSARCSNVCFLRERESRIETQGARSPVSLEGSMHPCSPASSCSSRSSVILKRLSKAMNFCLRFLCCARQKRKEHAVMRIDKIERHVKGENMMTPYPGVGRNLVARFGR